MNNVAALSAARVTARNGIRAYGPFSDRKVLFCGILMSKATRGSYDTIRRIQAQSADNSPIIIIGGTSPIFAQPGLWRYGQLESFNHKISQVLPTLEENVARQCSNIVEKRFPCRECLAEEKILFIH